jgi:hypothetical protein
MDKETPAMTMTTLANTPDDAPGIGLRRRNEHKAYRPVPPRRAAEFSNEVRKVCPACSLSLKKCVVRLRGETAFGVR